MALVLRPAAQCRFDLVSLGEVMLRFDPGEERIWTTRSFRVSEGGGEYNVARSLRRCFRLRTAIVTAFADNPVGRLLEDLILQGGVDQSYVAWVPYDGIGRTVRNGLNFTERGHGERAPIGCSDRGTSAASQMAPGDVDWQRLLGTDGARWFHTGGIFAGLSASTPELARQAMAAARRHGVIVSYDLNYRASLWQSVGGEARAREVNRGLLPLVDVLFGGREDFERALGFAPPSRSLGDAESFVATANDLVAAFPNLLLVATTLRLPHSASRHDWGAACYAGGRAYEATHRTGLEVFDRVGSGDAFAAGLIYGLLHEKGPAWAVECGAAHGALAMTTPGDTSMATLAEVERVMAGAAARVER